MSRGGTERGEKGEGDGGGLKEMEACDGRMRSMNIG